MEADKNQINIQKQNKNKTKQKTKQKDKEAEKKEYNNRNTNYWSDLYLLQSELSISRRTRRCVAQAQISKHFTLNPQISLYLNGKLQSYEEY